MIQPQSIVKIADNTGAKIGRVFKVLGGSKKRYARIGDLVVLSVQVAEPRKATKKKEVLRAVVVRQRSPFRRADGSYLRFDENAVVILEKGKMEPRGDVSSDLFRARFLSVVTRRLLLWPQKLFRQEYEY